MNPLLLAAQMQERGQACALCTVVRASGSVPRHEGSRMLVAPNGALLAGTVGGGEMEKRIVDKAVEAIRDGRPRMETFTLVNPREGDPGVCGGSVDVFIESLAPAPILLVIGAGHVGRALAHLGKWAGFSVIVADDRTELCNAEQCPGADKYLAGNFAVMLDEHVLTKRTYAALVTRSYAQDVRVLPLLLTAGLPYVGVMGSRRRWLSAMQELQAAGISAESIASVRAPIGLELQAETPEEIAISIMAQIVAQRRGGDGRSMSPL
jgi:xanthine dehydrogenase accessory factor